MEPNLASNPWELAWEAANSCTHVLTYLELDHMRKGEVKGGVWRRKGGVKLRPLWGVGPSLLGPMAHSSSAVRQACSWASDAWLS
jgi:hypothetical protein